MPRRDTLGLNRNGVSMSNDHRVIGGVWQSEVGSGEGNIMDSGMS